jgi:hypothetical protein
LSAARFCGKVCQPFFAGACHVWRR